MGRHPSAGATAAPAHRADLLEHTAIVVGDGARQLAGRTVGLLSGQRRIPVPNMQAKIAAQAAGLGHGFVPRACVRVQLETGVLVELPWKSRPLTRPSGWPGGRSTWGRR
nr:LysR substrate-binding domain-containing protein [Paracidovorax oryzae]